MSAEYAFFIGWSKQIHQSLGRFYSVVGVLFLTAFPLVGIAMGSHVDDPGRNLFASIAGSVQAVPQPWLSDQKFQGTLTLKPYPVLHVADVPGGPITRSLLLSDSGKHGATVPDTRDRVEALGGLVQRGDIAMLVLDDPPKVLGSGTPAPVAQSLGRWRAAGEICDGKCYTGAMTPGGGLAHRACASLCLIGEVPAIFVVATPVAGASFLLLAGPDGGEPPASVRNIVAKPVEFEGDVERIGQMLIFRVDPASAKVL